MKKVSLITIIFFLIAPPVSISLDDEELTYRYNIATTTSDLLAIRKIFGEILQSGDLDYSYEASKNVIISLDKIGNDLDKMVVPERMEDAYNVFLESVKSYRKSATCIRNAAEILLGYFDGSDADAAILMEKSTEYVELGNRYFDLSFDLHSEVFKSEKKGVLPKDNDNKEAPADRIPFDENSEKLAI